MSIQNVLTKYNENLYKEYINNHRLNVQKAWDIMKNNPDCIELINKNIVKSNIDFTIKALDQLIKNHDMSKYSEEEFDAYRKQFYPTSKEEKESNKENFDKAWKHHYFVNLHHWDWWYESGNMDNMSLIYVVEMICDWEAMGYQFGNTSKEWYENNKEKIHLGDRQRKFAEELMDIICK